MNIKAALPSFTLNSYPGVISQNKVCVREEECTVGGRGTIKIDSQSVFLKSFSTGFEIAFDRYGKFNLRQLIIITVIESFGDVLRVRRESRRGGGHY